MDKTIQELKMDLAHQEELIVANPSLDDSNEWHLITYAIIKELIDRDAYTDYEEAIMMDDVEETVKH